MQNQRNLAGTQRLSLLDSAWETHGAGPRLRAVRAAGERMRDQILAGPRALSVRTINLTTLPYPTRYAFQGTAMVPFPYVTLTHRCALVQFLQQGEVKNLLFNPSDIQASRATPFFARIIDKFHLLEPLLAKSFDSLEAQLAKHGLSPSDIDYIAFDHFHTQDLRAIMGTDDKRLAPRFPNAVLLAPKIEWEEWDDLHPMQRAWFIREGKQGVIQQRIAFTAGDYQLGDGVYLLRTPGHTSGNQTLFFHVETGIWGISENGTCADNWSPLESRIKGLASVCRHQDLDILLNSNTPELAADQYASMVLERTVVDRVAAAPAFVQMFPSSEVTPSMFAAGLTPTYLHKQISSGTLVRPKTRRAASAA